MYMQVEALNRLKGNARWKFKILQKLFLFSYQILFDGNDTQFQKILFFVPFWVPKWLHIAVTNVLAIWMLLGDFNNQLIANKNK